MLFRVIGYLVIMVLLVFIALQLVGRKPQWFKEPWKKILLYCVTFVCFVAGCYGLDALLDIMNI